MNDIKPFTRSEYHRKNPFFIAVLILLAFAIGALIQGFIHLGHICIEVILFIAFCTEVNFNQKKPIVEAQREAEHLIENRDEPSIHN